MEKSTIKLKIYYTNDYQTDLLKAVHQGNYSKIFLLTESTVNNLWVQKSDDFWEAHHISKIVIPAGEENKKLSSVEQVWERLSTNGGDRKSLLINIGGGMLTDLGGFAASTFKRGIDFINVPTTLLSQVDASVGGKTGINFIGFKNEIGTFREPEAVIIDSQFLSTLTQENILSGFAEMIKHGLIFPNNHLKNLRQFDFDLQNIQPLVEESVNIKSDFVKKDPTEKNIRKALNFGHTFGHAFESLAIEQDRAILHGYAVAYGMMCGLLLSSKINLEKSTAIEIIHWLKELYGKFELKSSDFEKMYHLMNHDKKNQDGKINCTTIADIGEFQINNFCTKDLVTEILIEYSTL